MNSMFGDVYLFNADISKWNVGHVRNMYYMFVMTKPTTATCPSGMKGDTNGGNILRKYYIFADSV